MLSSNAVALVDFGIRKVESLLPDYWPKMLDILVSNVPLKQFYDPYKFKLMRRPRHCRTVWHAIWAKLPCHAQKAFHALM